jgi:hypothetical protein
MARKVNSYVSKFSSVFIIIFVTLFLVNFCSTIQEENKIIEKLMDTQSSASNINDAEIQDKQCPQQLLLMNASFAVVLALLWNAKQVMKIGTI